MCLTLGIAMGSWWAYYELGWGGWWFWDPVENASFMPWLAATALLHSALVMEKREALKVWTILLAILAFSLSLMGTFLVRSGILTSVHAFAVDPRRGIFILTIMVVLIGGALALYAWRAPRLQQGGLFAPISREGALVLNNVLLTTACATVFIGTLYPLALESLTGAKISVGPPYFNLTFGPLMLPLLAAMPFGPYLAWKRGDLYGAAQRLFAAALAGSRRTRHRRTPIFWRGPWLAPFGIALGVWIIAGAVSEWATRVKLFALAPTRHWRRARGLPRSAYGSTLAHAGIGLTRARHRRHLGLAERERRHDARGREHRDRRLCAHLPRRRPGQGPNYQEQVGLLTVTRGGSAVTRAEPRQAPLRRAPPAHHRSRHPRRARRRPLRGAGRRAEGRQRLGRAPLLQPAGAPHLARRHCHGARRRPLPERPPPPHRRPPPRPPAARTSPPPPRSDADASLRTQPRGSPLPLCIAGRWGWGDHRRDVASDTPTPNPSPRRAVSAPSARRGGEPSPWRRPNGPRSRRATSPLTPPPLTPPRVALKARLRHDGEGDPLASGSASAAISNVIPA